MTVTAAGILLQDPTGRVLLLRRSRFSDFGDHWALPGGGVEPGEGTAEAAVRELREECGWDLPTWGLEHIGETAIPGGGEYAVFRRRVATAEKPVLNDEHTEAGWFKLSKLPSPLHPGVEELFSMGLAQDDFDENKHPRNEEGQFVYHGTSTGNIPSITEKGLVGDPYNYFADTEEAARGYAVGESTILRTQRANASGLEYAGGNRWGGKNEKTSARVKPEHLEYFENGNWVPVRKKQAQDNYTLGGKFARDGANVCVEMAPAVFYHPQRAQTDPGVATLRIASDAIAFDKTARALDADGHLRVASTPISKANVCGYYGREIPDAERLGLRPDKLYRLWRHPEELERGAATFAGKPLLIQHQPVAADDHPRDQVVGSIGDDCAFDGTYLSAPITVWDAEAIAGIDTGERRELSSSYRYVADMTPGRTPEGEAYDGVMRNIAANHVALVKRGRAGSDVMVADESVWALEGRFVASRFALSGKFAADAGEFDESKHKRDHGKFSSSGGSGGSSGGEGKTEGRHGYNPEGVSRAIASSSRHGPKIGKKEGSLIHRLLKGRGESSSAPSSSPAPAATKTEGAAPHPVAAHMRESLKDITSVPAEKINEIIESVKDKKSVDLLKIADGFGVSVGLAKRINDARKEAQAAQKTGPTLGQAGRVDRYLRENRGKDQAPRRASDSKETRMAKAAARTRKILLPSRRAMLTQGALMAYLAPRLAADAAIDLGPVVSGITNKNYNEQAPRLVAAVTALVDGKLAKDATIADLAEVVDAFKGTEVPEDAVDPALSPVMGDPEDPNDPAGPAEGNDPAPGGGDPALDPDAEVDPTGEGGEGEEMDAPLETDASAEKLGKVLEYLKDKLSPEDMAAVHQLCAEEAMDEAEQENDMPDPKKQVVTAAAMDEALTKAKNEAKQEMMVTQRAIQAALAEVRPYVGELAVACDSAPAVYRTALAALGVKEADKMHDDALRPVLLAQQLPSARRSAPAMDAAAVSTYATRFPKAQRIGHA